MELIKAEKVRNLLKVYDEAKARRECVEVMRDYLLSTDVGIEDKISYILNQVRENKSEFSGFLEKAFAEWVGKIAEDAIIEMERVRVEIEAL